MSLMLTNISQRLSQSQKMQILLCVQERRMSSLMTCHGNLPYQISVFASNLIASNVIPNASYLHIFVNVSFSLFPICVCLCSSSAFAKKRFLNRPKK